MPRERQLNPGQNAGSIILINAICEFFVTANGSDRKFTIIPYI
jgi:hypothetical protein